MKPNIELNDGKKRALGVMGGGLVCGLFSYIVGPGVVQAIATGLAVAGIVAGFFMWKEA